MADNSTSAASMVRFGVMWISGMIGFSASMGPQDARFAQLDTQRRAAHCANLPALAARGGCRNAGRSGGLNGRILWIFQPKCNGYLAGKATDVVPGAQ
jgi:hypothetical protein